MFKFNPRKLDAHELGRGELGVVYPYGKSVNDKKSVVKCIYVKNPDDAERAIQPIVFGFNQTHKNIVPVTGYRVHEEAGLKKIYVKMPRMKESLQDKINNYNSHPEKGNIPVIELVSHFYDVVTALEYLDGKEDSSSSPETC